MHSDAQLRRILESTSTIAVLGAHVVTSRPAHYVPHYLARHGYRIVPVNPTFAGQVLWGERCRATLTDIDEPVDLVDVFRRSVDLPAHLDDLLGMTHRPPVVWLQSGIRNDDFAASLSDRGIEVVQDRCTLAEHRRLFADRG